MVLGSGESPLPEDELERRRLRFVIEASRLGTWEWNVQTNETVFNEIWAEMVGYTLAELGPCTLSTWSSLTHPDDYLRARALLDACLAGEIREYTCEIRMKHKKGHWVWILDRGRVMTFDENSRPLLMFGTHDDITARKEEEAMARDREQFLGAVLETTRDGFCAVDWSGGIREANDAFCHMTGYSRDEIPRLGVRDIEALRSAEEIEQRLQRIARAGYDRFETRFRSKGGATLPVEVTSSYLERDGGQFISFCRDLTQRVHNEEALAASHDLLEKLAGLVPGVIYQYRLFPDQRSAFPYSSPGMFDIYEVTPDEVREDAMPVFRRLHPEDYDRVAEAIVESARTLQKFYCEYRVILPHKGVRWVRCEANPQRMDDGGALWHGIITDITEQVEIEAEREQLREQLAQAQRLESMGRLAGGIAHDFNNMLNVILGHADLMLDDLPPDSPFREGVSEIYHAAKRSAELTRQLLGFARKQTVTPKTLDLNDTVTSMLKMLQRLIGEEIQLHWKPAPPHALRPLRMDPAQIDQILANLVVNARDAIGHAPGNITIETGMLCVDEGHPYREEGLAPGDYLLIRVSDDGCGMDELTKASIFEPFFTTKSTGEGTGLGLATVYGIVKQNNGWIEVHSLPGTGSTFQVCLPAARIASSDAEPGAPPQTDAPRGKATLLFVEDEPAILALGVRMLERLGYTVLAAPSPGEALRIAEAHDGDIDLLVTDVVMPEMNGLELSNRIRERYPAIRCLFVSGYTADIIAHHGVLHEGLNLIPKPFTGRDLGNKVHEMLGVAP